jgi:D-alanyl-D-alanine carboxypeptidase
LDDYGYGLVKVPFDKYSGFGHTGGIDNFSSALFYFPDLKIATAFSTNQSEMDTNDISIKMIETAMGKDFEMPISKPMKFQRMIFRNLQELIPAKMFR